MMRADYLVQRMALRMASLINLVIHWVVTLASWIQKDSHRAGCSGYLCLMGEMRVDYPAKMMVER